MKKPPAGLAVLVVKVAEALLVETAEPSRRDAILAFVKD
jgi:hypothetical protein